MSTSSEEHKLDRLIKLLEDEKKAREPKNKCKHLRVQQFTETCLDCGKNVWTDD